MSPNKTLYIRDEDLAVWERAEQMSRQTKQSVSQLAAGALQRLLFPKSPSGLKVVVATDNDEPVAYSDSDPDGLPLLIFQRHAEHGQGWVLSFPHGDDYFIPGDISDVEWAIGRAQGHLDRSPEPGEAKFEAIRVEIGEQPLTVGFDGRWLVEPENDETRTGEEGYDAGAYWGIALTKRGRYAVFTAHCNEQWPATLKDYDTLDAAAADGTPADIIALAKQELGEEHVIIWRDI